MSVERLPAEVFPPHEYIDDEIKARAWSAKQLSAMSGLSVTDCAGIINGTLRVTPYRALKLSKAFGTSATLWFRLQRSWDGHERLTTHGPDRSMESPA